MIKLRKNKKLGLALLALSLFILFGARPAFCLPQGATVTNGTATFSNPNENTLEINASNKAIINYSSFDVAKNETVIINLPSINNSVLNRVLGSSASQILGSVVCNGIFIIINEKGIFFGPNSNINVGSLIASTRDISDTDFMNSNYIFSRLSKDQMDALILNQGQINISDGGFGIMIAGGIENAGTIAAKVGTIALAAGEMVHVDISPAGRVSIAIDHAQAKQVLDHQGKPITNQIKNTGTLAADGGVVLFKASSVGGIFEKAINLEGYVRADKFDGKSGLVKVVTSDNVKSKATVVASRIEIGSKEEGIIPNNVEIAGGSLTATEQGIEILANNDITTQADITSKDADIVLFADYDGNGVGSFAQLDGVIEATGTGNVYIDGSGTMTLGEVRTEEGKIVIGNSRAHVEIQGNPTYVHTAGDFQINLVQPGLITTTRADTLRYNPQGSLTLEATTGKVIDITNTPIEANKLTIIAAEAITINSAATTTEIYKTTGDMNFSSFSSLDNGQVNLAGVNIDLTYFKANNLTLQSNNAVRTTPGIVIQGNEVKIKAQYFGTIDTPLSIEANKTYIQRLYGNIDIMDSLGLGTSILLRGPPEGFGAIIYSHETNLFLEAEQINIVGSNPTYLYGDITFSNFYCTIPGKIIYFEAGYTYTILGEFNVQGAYGHLVKLLSSVDGQQWFIDPRGQRNITYAWVKDSYNISPIEIYAELSTSRGNNYNWDPVITWEGDDLISPNSWSDPNNWDLGVTPGVGDDVVFGAGGDVDCDIDTGGAVTVNSITIQAGYTSTITITSTTSLTVTTDFEQNNGTFNCSSATLNIGGDFTLTAGTFNGNSSTINITGDFTINSGSFTSTSGNLSIAGDLDIAGGFSHNNGTVILNGALQSILSGATFYNFTKQVALADTLYIQAGVNSIVVQGTLTLKGAAGQLLSIRSGTAAIPAPGQLWYIKFQGTTKDLDYLDVQDSYSYYSPILAPTHSTNSGHNWGWFASFIWTGAVDTDWNTAGNWNLGSVPGTNDNVIIPNVANDPTIGINANISYITIRSGAVLIIQDTFTLTARGDVFIVGTLTCQNAANVTVAGDWKNYGTFNCGTGLVTLNGLDIQTIYGNNTFYDLTKTIATASTLYFEANKTQIITNALTLQGAAGQLLSLMSSTEGTTWYIDVRVAPLAGAIDFVDVQDSYNIDFNLLGDILPTNSTNSGHNWRWFAAIEWNGAIDTDWATGGNWVGGSAPTAVDNVTIANVANDPIISSDVTISYLYINAGAVLTIDGTDSLTTSGDMINYGTLTCTGAAEINIGGNIRMSTFNAGTSTITFNGTTNQLMYDILTGAWAFYNIVLNNTGTADNDALGVSGLLAIDGDLTITDGEFCMAGLNAEIVGDIYIGINGSFVVSSILTWDYNPVGISTIHSDSSQPQDLGDIRVNSGALNIEGNVVCTGMDIDPGVTVTMLSNSSLTLTGDGTPLTGTGTLDCSTNTPNTIQYTSSADTDIIAAGPVSAYYRLILGEAYDTLVANTTSEANYKCAVIDTSGAVHYAYFGVGNSSPGLIVKVDLSTFTRVGILNLNYGENHLVSAVIDQANGFAYFGTYTDPGIVVKIDLSTFTRVGAVIFDTGEDFLTSATIDTTDGFAYFGTYTDPGYIVKVDINPAHAFAKIDSISMGSLFKSAAIDTTAAIHYAYFGTYTQPGNILKINLSDFTNTSAHSTLTLNTGEDYLTSCVIDTANGFIYFGTYTAPAQVIKIRASDLTRQDKITMTAVTDEYFSSAVIDTTNGYAYFGVGSAYSNVVKIDIDPARTFEKIADAYDAGSSGENNLDCAVIDTNNYAYFGSANAASPRQIVQYSIDPLDFAKEGSLQTTTGKDLFNTAVIDLNKEYAYIGTTGQAQVIKIRLSDFRIVGVLQTSDAVHLASSVIDEEYLYVAGFGSAIVRIDLANFTVQDSLILDVSLNEYDFPSASIDLVNDFAYFIAININTAPSRIIRIKLSTFDKVETLVLTGYTQGDNSAIDTTGGLLYLSAYNGTNTEIIKVDIDPAHAFAVLDSLELDDYYWNPPIAIDSSYLYVATGSVLSRINLTTFTLTDSLALDYNGPSSAVIDTTNGYAYFGANSGYPGNGFIYKIRLADFSLAGVIFTQPEDSNLICPFIDDTYVYFCSASGDINPGRIYRFTLSDTTAATATLGDAAGQALTINETLWVDRFNVNWETFDPAINLSGSFCINFRSSWAKSSSATLSWSPAGTQYFADLGATTSDIGNVLIAEGTGDLPLIYAYTNMITSPLTIGTTIATNTANILAIAEGRTLTNTGDITLNGGILYAQDAYITLTESIIINGDIAGFTGIFVAPLNLIIPGNLTVNGGAIAIDNAGSTIDVNGSVSIVSIGMILANGGSETINVAGNWTNANTSALYAYGFVAGTSTVVFYDATQTSNISGNTYFYNLTSNTSGKNLVFEVGSTQTIENTTTLIGANLRSSISGQYWYLYPAGSRNIGNVSVQDGYNLLLPVINPYGSSDLGHNVNWFYYDIWTPDPEEYNQVGSFWYEEGQRKRQRYPKGKYRTIVVVYEGKVVMTPYDETGLRTDETVTLVGGQSSAQDGEVK